MARRARPAARWQGPLRHRRGIRACASRAGFGDRPPGLGPLPGLRVCGSRVVWAPAAPFTRGPPQP
ncbi:hypothetical protein VULLAG_LOCUS8371 [Vulpes lagopus]